MCDLTNFSYVLLLQFPDVSFDDMTNSRVITFGCQSECCRVFTAQMQIAINKVTVYPRAPPCRPAAVVQLLKIRLLRSSQ
jgi:hypothetical protein